MEPAGFNDAAASGVELLDRLFETDLLKLQFICLFQNFNRFIALIGQHVDRRDRGVPLFVERSIQRSIRSRKALFHFENLFRLDVQLFRDVLCLSIGKRLIGFFICLRLKKSFLWAWVVASFTIWLFLTMYSWISARIQCTAKVISLTPLSGS